MNATMLNTAGGLCVLIGITHSYLGESRILMPMYAQYKLPVLRGSDRATKNVLRFAWHLTSVAWAGIGGVLFANRDFQYPLGFGGLPDELADDAALRRYLGQPLTFYLGTGDTIQDEYFDKSAESMKQGASRLERGRNAFRAGQELAQAKGWECRWRLVEAPDVAHVAAKMFEHPNCVKALAADVAR